MYRKALNESGYLLYLNGVLVHWHGRTERLIIQSTAAGEYIEISRGHAACKFIKTILQFYDNTSTTAHLFTDNQAAEHIATLNEHSRSIDIRPHAVQQDYIGEEIQIGGVKTTDNPSGILTKILPAPTHMQHSSYRRILFPIGNPPTPTLKPSTTTKYTQNGNYVSTPTTPSTTTNIPSDKHVTPD